MKKPAELHSPDRILTAAEKLFGEFGYRSVSLRQVTDEAGVNLAAVNYHFGSKEELYRQILRRRLAPLNRERLELLTQAQQLAGDQPVPLPAILDTFIRPLMRRAADAAPGGSAFLRLISRDLVDPQPFMKVELLREFEPLVARYSSALHQALPGLPSIELFWRLQFTIGALLYLAARHHDLGQAARGLHPDENVDSCIRHLVQFCAAGLGGPMAAPS